MNTFEELRKNIVRTVELIGDDPHRMGEPTKSQVIDLSRLWGELAGPYYEGEIGLVGWKNDWVRGAKHTFLENCCALAYPGQKLSMSTDLPREIYGLIIDFVVHHPQAVKVWITLHEDLVLERANLLMVEAFQHHVNRTPVLAAEHLPNLKGPTPAYPSADDPFRAVDAKQAIEELFDL